MTVIELLASSPAVFTGTCLVLGLVVGSFLNVVIYRLPVMLERSWREQCAQSSGEAASAALTLTWFLIALAFIDIDHQLLPDSLTLPLLWLGLLLSLWGGQAGVSPPPVGVRSSLIGAMAGYASLWSVYHLFLLLTGKEGMGYGDFKLFAALGAWLGWQMLLPIILMAAAVGSVVGIALIALRGRERSTPIAFGPFLAAAGWLMLMFGQPLLAAYLGLFAARP